MKSCKSAELRGEVFSASCRLCCYVVDLWSQKEAHFWLPRFSCTCHCPHFFPNVQDTPLSWGRNWNPVTLMPNWCSMCLWRGLIREARSPSVWRAPHLGNSNDTEILLSLLYHVSPSSTLIPFIFVDSFSVLLQLIYHPHRKPLIIPLTLCHREMFSSSKASLDYSQQM